jgi:hypothetical protein
MNKYKKLKRRVAKLELLLEKLNWRGCFDWQPQTYREDDLHIGVGGDTSTAGDIEPEGSYTGGIVDGGANNA